MAFGDGHSVSVFAAPRAVTEYLGFSYLRDIWTEKDRGREQNGRPVFAPSFIQHTTYTPHVTK